MIWREMSGFWRTTCGQTRILQLVPRGCKRIGDEDFARALSLADLREIFSD
jgi:hypothetical protein